jgi:hypothetical protein
LSRVRFDFVSLHAFSWLPIMQRRRIMSEYQYYEFRAIDRPLDQRARTALRAITSRAEITATSLVNVYHFGDFRGDPDRLMDQYFDAFVYEANWGTRRFMLRLPADCFDLADAKPYCVPYHFMARATKTHVILDFHSDLDGGDDFEGGEGWMADLIHLRAELLAGDLRCLYLAWFAGVQDEEEDDDQREPPVPPGLGRLSGPLRRLVDFLRLDPALVQAAAAGHPGEAPTGPSAKEFQAWVTALPASEKDELLLRVIKGNGVQLENELFGRFRRDRARSLARPGQRRATDESRRTVGALLKAGQLLAEEERRQAAEQAAQERERRARKQAAERASYLESLVGREEDLWRQVEAAIATKQAKEYQRAVTLLRDLHDLGEQTGTASQMAARIRKLRAQHSSKWSLLRRLDNAGFGS